MDAENTTRDTGSASDVERLRAERDALASELEKTRAKNSHGGNVRRVLVGLLVVLSCISLTVLLAGGWAFRTIFDTNKWVERVAPVIEEPVVSDAISARLTDQIFVLIDVEQLTADALPPRAAALAGPLTSAVRDTVGSKVAEALQSPQFQALWIDANRFAHQEILGVLRDEGEIIQRTGGEVSLNLLPIVNSALAGIEAQASGLFGKDIDLPEVSSGELPDAARAKIEAALGTELPDDFGEIPIYNSDKIVAAQDAMSTLDRSVLILAIVTPLFLILALVLSRTRRRTALQILIGSMFGLVVVRRLVMWLEDEVVSVVKEENRSAAQAVTNEVLSSFFSLSQLVIVIGLILVALLLLTGPYAWAVSFRGWTRNLVTDIAGAVKEQGRSEGKARWVASHRDPLLLGGSIFGVLLLFIFNLSFVAFLVVAALIALYSLTVIRVGANAPVVE